MPDGDTNDDILSWWPSSSPIGDGAMSDTMLEGTVLRVCGGASKAMTPNIRGPQSSRASIAQACECCSSNSSSHVMVNGDSDVLVDCGHYGWDCESTARSQERSEAILPI